MDEKTLATVRHRTTIGIYSISRITAEEEPDSVVEVWAGPSLEALEAENARRREALTEIAETECHCSYYLGPCGCGDWCSDTAIEALEETP